MKIKKQGVSMFERGKATTKELQGDKYNYASSQTHLEFSLDAKFK